MDLGLKLVSDQLLRTKCKQTLTTHLKVRVLPKVVLLRSLAVCQFAFLVVLIDQILDDRSGLPESDAGIWVCDGWDAAVGIDVCVRLLFNQCKVDEFSLVRNIELFQDDDNLPFAYISGCGISRGREHKLLTMG